MTDHFLTDIEIIDFKCFRGFKANGFQRVNLISGKNNVGKTAFMEACWINIHSKEVRYFIYTLINIKFMREAVNTLHENKYNNQEYLDFTKRCELKSNVGEQVYEINEKDAVKKYFFKIDEIEKTVNSNEIYIELSNPYYNIGFIDKLGWTDYELIRAFESIQRNDKENELNLLISSFDNNIISFKSIGNKPQCKVIDPLGSETEYRDLVEFGDGLKHYITIICALHACENGYLFIDEIDNGIHYTQLDNLWELILTISKKTNCQVFASTHSKEMLESFARVANKLEEKDVSFTTLVRNKNNEIKALTKDYDMLTYSIIEQEHEVR